LLCSALRNAAADQEPQWLEKLVEALCDLLQQIGDAPKAIQHGVCSELKRVLKARPALIDSFMATAAGGMQLEAVRFIMAVAPSPMPANAQAKFLELYKSQILVDRSVKPARVTELFEALERSITHADFAAHVQPELQKALKQAPDAAMPAVASLTGRVTIDLGAYAVDLFLEPLLDSFSADSAATRESSVRALGNLAAQCADAAVLEALTAGVASVLGGKRGFVTLNDHRMWGVEALEAIRRGLTSTRQGLGRAAVQGAVNAAVGALVAMVPKESNAEVLGASLHVLSLWLALQDDGHEAALALLRTGIEGKDKGVPAAQGTVVAGGVGVGLVAMGKCVRSMYVCGLLRAVGYAGKAADPSNGLAAAAAADAKLVAALTAIVGEVSAKKSSSSLDGVAAAAVLLRLATVDQGLAGALDPGVWALFSGVVADGPGVLPASIVADSKGVLPKGALAHSATFLFAGSAGLLQPAAGITAAADGLAPAALAGAATDKSNRYAYVGGYAGLMETALVGLSDGLSTAFAAAAVQEPLAETLAAAAAQRVGAAAGKVPVAAVCHGFVSLLTHPMRAVRAAASRAAFALWPADGGSASTALAAEVAADLLAALFARVQALASERDSALAAARKDMEEDSAECSSATGVGAHRVPPIVLKRALCAILGARQTTPDGTSNDDTDLAAEELIPQALLLAHHPMVCPPKRPHQEDGWCKDTFNPLWILLSERFGGVVQVSAALQEGSLAGTDLREILLSAAVGVQSAQAQQRQAARRVVGALLELPSGSLEDEDDMDANGGHDTVFGAEGVLPVLLATLQESELLRISPQQLLVWSTPAGVTAQEAVNAITFREEEVEEYSGPGASLDAGGDDGMCVNQAEEAAWEEEVRKELAVKAAERRKADEETALQLKKQADAKTKKAAADKKKKADAKKKEEADLGFGGPTKEKKKKVVKKKVDADGAAATAPAAAAGPSATPRAAAAAGKAAAKGDAKQDVKRVALLENEAATRARVGRLLAAATHALQAVAEAAAACSMQFESQLPKCVPVIMALQAHAHAPLAAAALRCLKALVGAADPCVEAVSSQLVNALRAIGVCAAGGKATLFDEDPDDSMAALLPYAGLMEQLLLELEPVCSSNDEDALPLPPYTLHTLFPVLDAVVSAAPKNAPTDYDGQLVFHSEYPGLQGVIGFFEMHAALGEDDGFDASEVLALRALRKPMLSAVLKALAAAAAHPQTTLAPPPEQVLAKLVRSSGGSEDGAIPSPLSVSEWGVLLGDLGLMSAHEPVRLAVLRALLMLAQDGGDDAALLKLTLPAAGNPLLVSRLWLSRHDAESEACRGAAALLWERCGSSCVLRPLYAPPLLPLLSHSTANVRASAAKALAAAVREHPTTAVGTLQRLFQLATPTDSELVVPTEGADGFPLTPSEYEKLREKMQADMEVRLAMPRISVARTLQDIGDIAALTQPTLAGTEQGLRAVLGFVVEHGLVLQSQEERNAMLKAGAALIEPHAEEHIGWLLTFLEGHIESGNAVEKQHSTLRKKMAAKAKAVDSAAEAWGKGSAAASQKAGGKAGRQLANAGEPDEAEQALFKQLLQLDQRREGLVVLLGTLARHLDKEDPKVAATLDTLVQALDCDAEAVQLAVADCLWPLVKKIKDTQAERTVVLIDEMLAKALEGESVGERRGGAHGVSAAVKGLGIAALKAHNVVPRLQAVCDRGKGTGNSRQGALFTFECLCGRLGLLFEPYVISIMPILLQCFSDTSSTVQAAASKTGKMIMSKLTTHGVKLVLPALLGGLSDNAWRTKQASIQLLGAMAHCAPKQLSACLPQVVPRLTEAFTDTHPKVLEAGRTALEDLASVIKNPEIKKLAKVLLQALADPTLHTHDALMALQETAFVHSIDSPSLALIVPILNRGLRQARNDVKRKAALIVGNICSMVNDPKDLQPYVKLLMPQIKKVLVDPIPDVRAIAAKAMGRLCRGMGEETFPDLVPWLVEQCKANSTSVERSGAAQGLADVCVALGDERLDAVLAELLPLADHPGEHIREGVLWLVAFLPMAMGRGFARLIAETLPLVTNGFADDSDGVREVALRAGTVIVTNHSMRNTQEVLPPLVDGMFNKDYRIRQSCVVLVGDLLYKVSGTKAIGMVTTEGDDDVADDEGKGSAEVMRQIVTILGVEARDEVMGGLYMLRCDPSAIVRQCALQVWKSVVPNTPRMLREILPTLLLRVVELLSSEESDQQGTAARLLGDVVRKLGDRVMPEVIPILQKGLEPGNDAETRAGVCVGLTEVLRVTTKANLEGYVDTLIQTVQTALTDESSVVRMAAATTFQTLNGVVGERAVGDILPTLLERLDEEDDDTAQGALDGIREILNSRAKQTLPVILPKLLAQPITGSHARALCTVAEVVGPNMHHHLKVIFPALTQGFLDAEQEKDDALLADIKAAFTAVCLAIDEDGCQWLCVDITKQMQPEEKAGRDAGFRRVAMWLGGNFCQTATVDYSMQLTMLLQHMLLAFHDEDKGVVLAAKNGLLELTKSQPAEVMAAELDHIRGIVAGMASDAKHRLKIQNFECPGFCLPKGLDAVLPAYQHALLYGTPEAREAAASGIGELIQVTSAAALKPYLIKMTGPLIRIVGDRFVWQVKAAIYSTLTLLLDKGGATLKPFLPQLQTQFVKALKDPTKVRCCCRRRRRRRCRRRHRCRCRRRRCRRRRCCCGCNFLPSRSSPLPPSVSSSRHMAHRWCARVAPRRSAS
jgi:hypothetical protein